MFDTLSLAEMLRNKINNPRDDLSKNYLLHKSIEIHKSNIKKINQISDYLFLIEANKNYLISFVLNTELIETFKEANFSVILVRRGFKKFYYDILFK